MTAPKFQPGFRLSALDCVVIVVGVLAVFALWSTAWWISFVIGFVVAHFFLFCNVFRMARPLELAWSGIFMVLTFGTIAFEMPSWPLTIAASLLATVGVVAVEMRKPSYHGVFWQRLNPELPEWWARNTSARQERNGISMIDSPQPPGR